MKAKELIIGDLVLYFGKAFSILKVDPETELSIIEDARHFEEANINDLSPIPLTPNILEKNGWKKFKRPYSRDYCFRRKGYPTLNIRSEKEVYFHWGDHDKSITTVHQLQHLLYGLGLNSEMEV